MPYALMQPHPNYLGTYLARPRVDEAECNPTTRRILSTPSTSQPLNFSTFEGFGLMTNM
jgi:hypothetical protein